MNDGEGTVKNMWGEMEEKERRRIEIEGENDDRQLMGEGDEEVDDNPDDWSVPANYRSLKFDAALGGQSVWQCVKRPWKPEDYQLTDAQRYAKKKKEKKDRLLYEAWEETKKQQGAGGTGATDGKLDGIKIEEDGDEPGISDLPDQKFQYYWRLSAPQVYQRAGAVGQHWRPIRLDNLETKPGGLHKEQKPSALDTEEELRVGWINETQWKRVCQMDSTFKTVPIHVLEGNKMVSTSNVADDIKCPEKGLDASQKRRAIIKYIKSLATDETLKEAAQKLMTDEKMIPAPETSILGGQTKLRFPYRFTDGTFVFSKGAIDDVPTSSDDGTTDRIYVKLRKTQINQLEVSGGRFNAAKGDTFILKEKLDELAGMRWEKDPTIAELEAIDESMQWKSDARVPLSNEDINLIKQRQARRKAFEGAKTQVSTPSKRAADRTETPIWVRDANGFAFQFTFTEMDPASWDKNRVQAIRSLEGDRGWTRYIDPAIPLFIVPSSDEIFNSMHVSITHAMEYLDMPLTFINVPHGGETDEKLLATLRIAGVARPDCATTMVHLIHRRNIKEDKLKKLALSPFGHYETWITKEDWNSYILTREDRTAPGLADVVKIQEARRILREKGAEAKKAAPAADRLPKATRKKNNKEKRGLKKKKEMMEKKKRGDQDQEESSDEEVAPKTAVEIAAEEQALVNEYHFLNTPVSANKIQGAKGARKVEKRSQATVMGCSATLIARALGWKDYKNKTPPTDGVNKWPGTSHMPAEWLHRCAYSWGGFEEGGPSSSQHRSNLIFGTGECNSVMTRYEKAWQALVCREGDRLKRQGYTDIGSGNLYANINRKTYRAQFGIEIEEGSRRDKEASKQPMTANEQEMNLPHWMCYALEYVLVQNEPVEPFSRDMEFKTVFYPWQRGFFTKFEQTLDEVVLERAYEAYEPVEEKPAIPKPDKKTVGKGQTKDIKDLEGKKGGKQGQENKRGPGDSLIVDKDDESQSDDKDKPEEEDADEDEEKKLDKKVKTDSVEQQGNEFKESSVPGNFFIQSQGFSQDLPGFKHDDSSSKMGITSQKFSGNQFFSLMAMPELTASTDKFWLATATKDAKIDAEAENAATSERGPEKKAPGIVEEFAESTDNATEEATAHITNAGRPTPEMCSIWEEVHAPGPSIIDGLFLTNAEVVVGNSSIDSSDSVDPHNANDSIESSEITGKMGKNERAEKAEKQQSSSNSSAIVGEELTQLPHAQSMPEPMSYHLETTKVYAMETLPELKFGKEQEDQELFAAQINTSQTSLEPTFYNTESSNMHAIQNPSNMKAKEQIYASQASSKLKPTAQNQQNPPETYTPSDTNTSPVPEEFVLKADFKLFGKHRVKLQRLQSAAQPDAQHYRIDLPTELSLGVFMPSLAGSDLDAIALRNTTVGYRSRKQQARLTIATTITLHNSLQPVNTFLRDVFGQTTPCIDVTTHLSSSLPPSKCLTQVPQPLAFTMRGELPKVNIPDLFGVLTVTHIGIDVMGRRRGSAGGYDLGYAFFGRGHVDTATTVKWRISKFDQHWSISIYTESSNWTNVTGIDGVDLKNVFMEAAWMGTKLSTVRLDLRATFSIKEQATLMLRGKLSRNDFEVAGYLANCSLTTLKQLYNQTFGTDIDVTTEHEIVLDSLVLIVSKKNGISLYGAVSVDGHAAAEASISIGGGCIAFEGSLTKGFSVGSVTIEQPELAVSIYTSSSDGSGFEIQFSGKISITDKHHFDVLVHLSKMSGKELEYTVYGAYDGAFYLHDLNSCFKNTDLLRDVGMRKLAVCVSNIEKPAALIKTKPPGYDITRGLTLYSEVELPVISDVLGVAKGTPLVVCASYRPPTEGGDGSKFQISIRIPSDDIFKIDRFSVGNIALTVAVIDSQPSIEISGDLSFPIDDDQKLKLALGLSAGVYEARGEAELKTSWVNPFQLNKAVTINNLKAGLGIIYEGGVPSNITLGGDVVVGKVHGSVIIHTGIDPSKQLLHVNIINLDVADLLKTIGSLIEVDLIISGGANAFFIRKLEVYLSTGVELFNVYHPRGVRLDVDMMLFGKRTQLEAEVSKGRVILKGSIDQFKIGDLVVCAASGNDKRPYVDMELSRTVQRIKVDGKIIFGEDKWIIVKANIDTAKGTFNLYFELIIGDTLKVIVIATLDGGLPEATQSRVEEAKDEKTSNSSQEQPSAQQQSSTQSLITQAGKDLIAHQASSLTGGGQLQGKTFTVYAKVEQDIVNYLVNLANDLLSEERKTGELQKLEASLNTAVVELSAAMGRYETAKIECDEALAEVTNGLDKHMSEIKEQIMREQMHMVNGSAKLEQDERNMVLQAAQDERDLAEKEQHEAAAAEGAAHKAHVEVEEWRARLIALQTAEKVLVDAVEVLDAAEVELAATQVALLRHVQKEPESGVFGPRYEPWRWESQDLATEVQTRELKRSRAVDDVKLAKIAFKQLGVVSCDEATTKLEELIEQMKEADETAQARRAAVDVNIQAGRAKADEQRANLQKRRAQFIAHANRTIEKLMSKEAAFEQERRNKLDAARVKYDVSKTEAGTLYDQSIEKHRAADIKLRAYKYLKESIATAGETILTPLRFAVNVVGKVGESLLTIQSFELDGKFGGSSSHVAAEVKCKIGGFNNDFNFRIDLCDIVSFLVELWEKIKSVIASVASPLLELARKGIEEVKKFCVEAATEVKEVVSVTADKFMKELAACEKEVEDFLDDIDRGFLQPFKIGSAVVLNEVFRSLDEAGLDLTRGLLRTEIGRNLARDLIDTRDKIDGINQLWGGPLGSAPRAFVNGFGRGIFGLRELQDMQLASPNANMDEERRRMETERDRGEKEVRQLREVVEKGKMKLDEIKEKGGMRVEEMVEAEAQLERMIRVIEIRQMQGNIRVAQFQVEEMRRNGRGRDEMRAREADIVKLESYIGLRTRDIETKDIMRELRRRQASLEEIRMMETEGDDAEMMKMDIRAMQGDIQIRDWIEKLEMVRMEMRMLEVMGVERQELEGKRKMMRVVEREMEKKERTRLLEWSNMELRRMEIRRVDAETLKSCKSNLISSTTNMQHCEREMEELQSEIEGMESRGDNPRHIQSLWLKLGETALNMRRAELVARMELHYMELKDMEVQPRDENEMQSKWRRQKEMELEIRRNDLTDRVEKQEITVKRLELVGANRREIEIEMSRLGPLRQYVDRCLSEL